MLPVILSGNETHFEKIAFSESWVFIQQKINCLDFALKTLPSVMVP